MSDVSAKMVKALREKTGAGMMDCKKALSEAGGDEERAIAILRKQGLKKVGKRAGKVASEGCVYSYIHPGGRVGVLLELNAETDFVARSEEFLQLAKSIAMHIAWAKPAYIDREGIPKNVIASEEEVIRAQLKPGQEKFADKIVAGRLSKFYEDVCLLDQIDARDLAAKKKIGDIVSEVSAKLGEKILVRRFQRFEVGEGIEKAEVDYAAEVEQAVKAVG